jgi:hypothetical protein
MKTTLSLQADWMCEIPFKEVVAYNGLFRNLPVVYETINLLLRSVALSVSQPAPIAVYVDMKGSIMSDIELFSFNGAVVAQTATKLLETILAAFEHEVKKHPNLGTYPLKFTAGTLQVDEEEECLRFKVTAPVTAPFK